MFRLARSIVRPLQQHYYQNASGSQAFYMQRFSYHSLFINPPVHEVPELTTQRITEIFAADIGQAKEYSAEGLKLTAERREALMKLLPAADEQLPPRTMKDSFVTAIVPLKSQPEIRERYVTADGRVRIGRLLEDMDVFAVFCCFRHILNPKSVGHKNPYSVVTALVDSIYITNDMMKNSEDVRLSGHVTYAGKSSMEVCIVVDQKDDQGVYQKSFDAVFLMVARDPMNRGSARINPLVAETPEEQAFLKMGVARQQIRRGEEEENIFKKSPNEEERKIIHDRFIEKMNQTLAGATPTNSKRMKDSVLKTVLICQPQYRNRYNKIFGGFIMRMAYELAFTNTLIYGKKRPRILNIDDIKFQLPVEIGSILRLRSHIGYVEGDLVHSVVIAEIVNPKTGEVRKSNEFHVTFLIPREAGDEPVPSLEFETYEEAIYYLDSRRHFKKMMEEFGDFVGNIGK